MYKLILISIFSCSLFLSGCTNKDSEKNIAPLSQFLEFSSDIKADFITNIISPVSGDKSSFSSCLSSAPVSSGKEKIYALVNSSNFEEMLKKTLIKISFQI